MNNVGVVSNYLEPLVGAHLIIKKDDSIFMIRRANTGAGDGLYSVPAGHVDVGESPLEAAVREAKEEVGITVDPQDLTFVHVVHNRKESVGRDRMQFFFITERWIGEPSNTEPHKCDDACWFKLLALPVNIVKVTAQALELRKKEIFYSELFSDRM